MVGWCTWWFLLADKEDRYDTDEEGDGFRTNVCFCVSVLILMVEAGGRRKEAKILLKSFARVNIFCARVYLEM